MSISRALRFQILRRDDHTCRYCGRKAPDVKLQIDHVVPETLGGGDEPENLVTACADCNGGKAATPPDAARIADITADALRWSAARKIASADLGLDRAIRDEFRDLFLQSWNSWTYEEDGKRKTLDLPNDWPLGIDRFHAAGLTAQDLSDAVDIAMRTERVKDTFKYFCGVAWGMARKLDERTGEILNVPPLPVVNPTSLETRTGTCRIACPHCSRPFEALIEVVAEGHEGPLKLRGMPASPAGADDSDPDRQPWSLSESIADLLDPPS